MLVLLCCLYNATEILRKWRDRRMMARGLLYAAKSELLLHDKEKLAELLVEKV